MPPSAHPKKSILPSVCPRLSSLMCPQTQNCSPRYFLLHDSSPASPDSPSSLTTAALALPPRNNQGDVGVKVTFTHKPFLMKRTENNIPSKCLASLCYTCPIRLHCMPSHPSHSLTSSSFITSQHGFSPAFTLHYTLLPLFFFLYAFFFFPRSGPRICTVKPYPTSRAHIPLPVLPASPCPVVVIGSLSPPPPTLPRPSFPRFSPDGGKLKYDDLQVGLTTCKKHKQKRRQPSARVR